MFFILRYITLRGTRVVTRTVSASAEQVARLQHLASYRLRPLGLDPRIACTEPPKHNQPFAHRKILIGGGASFGRYILSFGLALVLLVPIIELVARIGFNLYSSWGHGGSMWRYEIMARCRADRLRRDATRRSRDRDVLTDDCSWQRQS